MYHGKITEARKKRNYDTGGKPVETKIGAEKKTQVRAKGGARKVKLVASDYVMVSVGGKNIKCRIMDLTKNPANKDFTRRRIITKGAVLKAQTPEGKEVSVKVTSRPGQTGTLNGIME